MVTLVFEVTDPPAAIDGTLTSARIASDVETLEEDRLIRSLVVEEDAVPDP